MLRAIWTAIVVLPVPCAPPMSRSSPARSPPPIVLSSGEKPSGTGWYWSTAPTATFWARVASTSVALRGDTVARFVPTDQTPGMAVTTGRCGATVGCGAIGPEGDANGRSGGGTTSPDDAGATDCGDSVGAAGGRGPRAGGIAAG